MLNHSYEFIRIADAKPDAEKVTKRQEAATDLVAILSQKQHRELLLACVQGVIAGFESGHAQDSPVVTTLLRAVKAKDSAFPNDLTENAQELRACAAIAVGEILVKAGDKDHSVAAALAIRSALGVRPQVREKHARFAIEKIQGASEDLLATAANNRRQRASSALRKLQSLEDPGEGEDVWKTVMPPIRAAFREIYAQVAADREEIDSLWWYFQGYSDIAQKRLESIPVSAAIICAGIELAERAVIPPLASSNELVNRAIEHGRKASESKTMSLQDLMSGWDDNMMGRLAPAEGAVGVLITLYPALLPISKACRRRLELGSLSKGVTSLTGLSLSQSCEPAEWSRQIFNERVLQRVLTDTSGS